jgi:ribonuclease D
LKKHIYIKSDKELKTYINQLETEGIEIVAMDFEAEYNLHEYGEKLCLIQIYDGKRFVIIDPVTISAEGLKQILENQRVTKIFYDAGTDKTLVHKQYGISLNSILDLMDPVKLLNFQKKGLDSILDEMLSIKVVKKKKFQMHNWTIRPIQDDAIEYALSDVEHLFSLKDALLKKIIEENLYEKLLIGEIQNNRDIKYDSIPGVKKRKSYKLLAPHMKKRFDSVFTVRDKFAKKLNLPPNSVISNDILFDLAKTGRRLDSSIIHSKISRAVKSEILVNLKDV